MCSACASIEGSSGARLHSGPDAGAHVAAASVGERRELVIDTDLGADVDDAGALAVAFALEREGRVHVAALVSQRSVAADVVMIHAIATYYGRADIPIGVRGTSAARVYRETLAGAGDQSVTLVAIGPMTNLAELLKSAGDAVSPLSGRELIASKVRELVAMGGTFPTPRKRPEHNFGADLPALRDVLANWPTPITFVGSEIGGDVMTGDTLVETPPDNPVRLAYEQYLKGKAQTRPSWDQTAVVYASRDHSEWWSPSSQGHVALDPGGWNSWTVDPHSQQTYIMRATAAETLRLEINRLMSVQVSDGH